MHEHWIYYYNHTNGAHGVSVPTTDFARVALFPEGCPTDNPEDDARRIVACVNACAGIDTEDLEPGSVQELAQLAAEKINRLTAALNDCAGQFEKYADHHRAKGDTEKAEINAAFAKMAREAILK